MRNNLLFCFLVFFCAVSLGALYAQDAPGIKTERPDNLEAAPEAHILAVFYSSSCHSCIEINRSVIPEMQAQFGERISIRLRDISRPENYRCFLGLQEKYGFEHSNELPVFFLDGRFLAGSDNIRERLAWFIKDALSRPPVPEGSLPEVDPTERFRSFRPFAIAGAGLIDGINPCAFTVMVFFMSFLALQRYRRRELLAIGLAFIFAVFATYVLVGLGLFGFLYRLRGFWVFSKAINISVGLFSLVLAGFALYDFFVYLKNKDTAGLILQLPGPIKKRIQAVVGAHYRKGREETAVKKNFTALLASALATGFLVSLLEAVCTGQLYLPTLIFVFKTTPLKLAAFSYILLYNVMFIVPLAIIFLAALFGITSQQFASFLKKHLALVKLLMAAMFLVLGAALIYLQAPASGGLGAAQEEALVKDFGRVKEGVVLRHDFLFRNTSMKPLVIKQVDTSCGCTLSRIKKRVLGPGDSTRIEVYFKTKGYAGPTQQFVYVRTDDLDNPVVRFIIKADVVRQEASAAASGH